MKGGFAVAVCVNCEEWIISKDGVWIHETTQKRACPRTYAEPKRA